jgi:hypothetical protein
MLSVLRPSFEVVKKRRILNFVLDYRKFEFADIVFDEKTLWAERILAYELLFDLYLSLS